MKVPPFFSGPVNGKIPPTERGAAILADRIMEVWRAAGHDNVHAWPERIVLQRQRDGDANVFIVKTNLVRGLPPPRSIVG